MWLHGRFAELTLQNLKIAPEEVSKICDVPFGKLLAAGKSSEQEDHCRLRKSTDTCGQNGSGVNRLLQAMMKTQTFIPENLYYFGKAGGGISEVYTPAKTVTASTLISDVINEPVFENYGRFIFPLNTGYYRGDTLGNLSLTWYTNIKPPEQ